MFSLIITIISIALVAALAVATIYYGGSAFTQGTARANAAALVSASQQVQGADTLFQNDNAGAHAATIAALVTGEYLQAAPTLPAGVTAFTLTNGVLTATVANEAVCEAVARSAGMAAMGVGDDTDFAYNCFETAADSGVYSFRFGN